MISSKNREDSVKDSIPRQLHMAIIRLQGAEDLDWDEACTRASVLINQHSGIFKRAVENRALSLYRSRHMSEMNKIRKAIEDKTRDVAVDMTRHEEDNFRVPCSICGETMYFSSTDEDWEEAREFLLKAFAGWKHADC
ncbi:hypothetical protein MUP77_12810 [Candidatus Bathyarchaeota archaeon]|nr:hypothetical protein [Candidatus Bathyarchaeota archaeon]